jgi:hypothetical protein
MQNKTTDVDIDFANREQILNLLPHVPAMQRDGNSVRRHNTGVYFHNTPINPFNGLATLDYKTAEEKGWFKIDLLNVGIYGSFTDNKQIDSLLAMEPMWELLEHDEIIGKLFHIHNHADTVKRLRPKSVEQLAAVLAVIRPGKKHLIGQPWSVIDREVWQRPENDDYFFKRSHAMGYALAIVLQMNMLVYGVDSA